MYGKNASFSILKRKMRTIVGIMGHNNMQVYEVLSVIVGKLLVLTRRSTKVIFEPIGV